VDAYVAWRTFTSGAFEDRDREHVRVVAKRDQLFVIRRLLVDLVQDVMKFAGRRVRPPTNSTRSKTDSMTCVVCEVTAPPGPPR